MIESCPLCNGLAQHFFSTKNREFLECEICKGIFVPTAFLPPPKKELARYKLHHNDVNDKSYQRFVSPLVNAVAKDFKGKKPSGLDYGAGPGPVITKMLRERNFNISPYDPFFKNDENLLEQQYDFIVCCEVIEHFHHPRQEFEKLKDLLLPNGKIYCMTNLYSPELDFAKWNYKNDLTHVFFYKVETLEYIVRKMGFSGMFLKNRLIVLSSEEKN
ncbi:class I SAM-dependent methyltransferase [Salinimicrobium sp. GXAS 041]|uniref:class I SAM-dependent methyltransferase n=1 Tax=Salinimicrobium sp. GXAS 041 TaxID=3400806 RepID=UPI003C76D83F